MCFRACLRVEYSIHGQIWVFHSKKNETLGPDTTSAQQKERRRSKTTRGGESEDRPAQTGQTGEPHSGGSCTAEMRAE